MKLQGRITLDGTDPATGAVVEIHNGQGDILDQVQVDSEGRYRYHLSEGAWVLKYGTQTVTEVGSRFSSGQTAAISTLH